jgi:oxygen-independent coproporphyrinogen-3 oxidase
MGVEAKIQKGLGYGSDTPITTKMTLSNNQNAGLYIHIPLCVKKCPYCDFYSQTDLSLKQRFLETLLTEMEMVSAGGLCFDTLYIGGGTPSVYGRRDIGQIVAAAQQNFDLQPDSEITIEVNPGTTSNEKLKGYREAGTNRINIGAQSFNQHHLDFLGRIHSPAEARKTITDAHRAGFKDIGLDLIYGLPEQSRADWREDLKQAVAKEPTHISCYILTYEKETFLYSDLKNGQFQPLPDGGVRALFETTIEFLEDNGYFQYEISNFARVGKDGKLHISKHNLKYWTLVPYIGLGPSAHSFIEPQRYWNVSSIGRYLEAIESGRSPIDEKERLTPQQEMIEAIYLGLRMTQGIDLTQFRQKFGLDFLQAFKDAIADLQNKDYLKVGTTHAALTRRGRAFLDSIASIFVAQDVTDTQ